MATRLLERELSPDAPGFISLVTLAEIVWVITSVYSADRALIERAVEGLLSAQQLRVQDAESVWLALQDWRDSDADFSDALIARVALAAGCTHTCTFDRAAAKNSGFELLN